MNSQPIASQMTRRSFSFSLASLLSGLGLPRAASASSRAAGREEISHDAESIHMEVVFKASPKRVYEALTDARQFRKATGGEEVEISPEVGGAFSLFGRRIAGRHIELAPNERIVQAWRSNGWAAGDYSIARFELKEQGAETKLIFDHTGFPKGQAEHLLTGWETHYWDSLRKYLAS